MTAFPPWLLDFDGEVHVVPAHGREPGEYLAKLGRVYLDHEGPWTTRLGRMLAFGWTWNRWVSSSGCLTAG